MELFTAGSLTTIHDIAEIIAAAATAYLAYAVYSYTKKRESVEASSKIQTEWQQANQIALSDPEILEIESKNHPHGKLDASDMKKLYWYFMLLNISYNTWSEREYHADTSASKSNQNNIVNVTYKDRDFIKDHVPKRGYSRAFARFLESGWSEIEKNGMKGME